MFETLTAPEADSLMVVGKRVREDSRADKLDLGIGVYRDETGATPIMPAVRKAFVHLAETQPTKAYLSPAGDPLFTELLARHVLTPALATHIGDRLAALQAPGGTGALRLAAELISASRPDATVWLGTPTWPNHAPILNAVRQPVADYRAIDLGRQCLLFDAIVDTLERAAAGDVILLQGCCQNPSGIDLDDAHWDVIADIMERRGLIPLVDFAYQGLGVGIEEDARGARLLFDRLPEAMLAASCSKSFGLYRERAGLLIVKATTASAAQAASAVLQTVIRVLYSNPPDHGAAIVRTILQDDALTAEWRAYLDGMRARIVGVRQQISRTARDLQMDMDYVERQRGLFSMLPLNPAQVRALGERFAIHMPETGRVNIAGLSATTVPRFMEAIVAVHS
jgi:aromatic-amino-acid transaminase